MFDGVRAFWMLNANFGDNLNHYLLSRIAGGVVYTEMAEPVRKIVAVGSILNWCDESCVAWGCGLASRSDVVNPATEIRAVRGPLSRERALECGANVPEVYGDPALLLPLIYQPQQPKRYRLGIIPHYVDQVAVFDRYYGVDSAIKVIDILDTPERVIDDIASCDAIASSSLHGVITANAYGIPAAWLEFSSKIGGDGMKYIDYFQSVDCGIDTSVNCRDLPAIQVLIDRVATHLKASFRVDVSGLLENCPFPCNLVR